MSVPLVCAESMLTNHNAHTTLMSSKAFFNADTIRRKSTSWSPQNPDPSKEKSPGTFHSFTTKCHLMSCMRRL